MPNDRLEIVIQAVDRFSKPLAEFNKKSKQAAKTAGKALRDSFKKVGKVFGGVFTRMKKSLLSLKGLIVGLLAGAALKKFFTSVTSAAIAQEEAVSKLNNALKLTDRFSKDLSQSLLADASALQKITRVGDETTIGMQALFASFGATEEEIKRATRATIGLSSAIGVDLNAASILMAKALQGDTSSLSRYGIKIEEGLDSTKKFAAVLSEIEGKKFFELAVANTDTLAGRIAQMKNAFGDFLELIGLQFAPVLKKINETLAKFFASGRAEKFAKTIGDLVKGPLEKLNTIISDDGALEKGFNKIIEATKEWKELLQGVLDLGKRIAKSFSNFSKDFGPANQENRLREAITREDNKRKEGGGFFKAIGDFLVPEAGASQFTSEQLAAQGIKKGGIVQGDAAVKAKDAVESTVLLIIEKAKSSLGTLFTQGGFSSQGSNGVNFSGSQGPSGNGNKEPELLSEDALRKALRGARTSEEQRKILAKNQGENPIKVLKGNLRAGGGPANPSQVGFQLLKSAEGSSGGFGIQRGLMRGLGTDVGIQDATRVGFDRRSGESEMSRTFRINKDVFRGGKPVGFFTESQSLSTFNSNAKKTLRNSSKDGNQIAKLILQMFPGEKAGAAFSVARGAANLPDLLSKLQLIKDASIDDIVKSSQIQPSGRSDQFPLQDLKVQTGLLEAIVQMKNVLTGLDSTISKNFNSSSLGPQLALGAERGF